MHTFTHTHTHTHPHTLIYNVKLNSKYIYQQKPIKKRKSSAPIGLQFRPPANGTKQFLDKFIDSS